MLVRVQDRHDDATAVRRLRRRRARRETLGFGAAETVTLVSATVWLMLNQVAREIAVAMGDDAAKGLRDLFRRLLRRRRRPVVVPPLNAAQLDDVHDRIHKALVEDGLSRRRAQAIADRVFRELTRERSGVAGRPDGVVTRPGADTARR
jgi:hypothetical protein